MEFQKKIKQAGTYKNIVAVTGVTGAFGEYLIESLLKNNSTFLILLVRSESQDLAEQRLKRYLSNNRIVIARTDLAENNLGLEKIPYQFIQKQATHILHAAASTRFTHTLKEARKRNVNTTKNVIDFVKTCKKLKRFAYVSSALVAGKRIGLILEEDFEHTSGFINTYEQSKYEAEKLVREIVSGVPTVIFRPPLVISKPKKDYQGPVNLLSHSLRLLEKNRLPLLPGTKDSVFDVVDSIATADAIATLTLKEKLDFLTYHISNGNRALTAGHMLKILELHLSQKIKTTFCGDMKIFRRKLFWVTLSRPWLNIVYKKTESYLPELAYPKIFDNTHLLNEMEIKQFGPDPEKVFCTILK